MQQQQQQPPVATSAPAPVVTAPGVVAPSPLVYQQLASGQIQMYQLPPGYVPVLVSNTGSLQPLVSLPPQPQIPQQPQPSIDSLGVPADNNSRRSSSNVQGYEYAAPMQMMIVPEQQQQQPQQQQQQPQMVVQAEPQPQMQMPMEYTSNQPQQVQQPQESYQPSMVMQQPQMVPEAYNGQQQQPLPVQPTPEPYVQQQQQPMVMQPQMVPDGYTAAQAPMPVAETFVQQPQTLAETYVPTATEAYVQPHATEPLVDGSQLVHGEPTMSEEVYHQQAVTEAEHLNNPQEAEMLEDSCVAVAAEDLEAVEGIEDCLEEGCQAGDPIDVSGLLQSGQVATHSHAVGYVVHHPVAQHVQYQVHPSAHSVSSSTLYSATSMSSLSSSCDYLSHASPYYTHSHPHLSIEEQTRLGSNQQRKNSAGPVIGQASGHASLIAASDNAALLRRGSLPHTILLMKQDFQSGIGTNVSALGSNSRRSSSGTVVPLATLREKAGDSDMSNEDLSQVSLVMPKT